MNILDFDYSTEFGFAHILVEGNNGAELVIQCCLSQEEDHEDGFKTEIIMSDCGHMDGICYDANSPAFKLFGENRCMKALFAKAKEHGIEVI